MALYSLIGVGLLACLSALDNWRTGVLWMIVIAAIQDPLRKLVPGAPSSTMLIILPVILCTGLGMLGENPTSWLSFKARFPAVMQRFNWFALACLPAVLISLTYGAGSWAYTLFGLISYGTILGSVLIGYHYIRDEQDIRRMLSLYCIVTALALTGTFLEHFDSSLFPNLIGTDAMGFDWVRHRSGYIVKLIAGFYRSPDVMGWHAATAGMLSLVLAFGRKKAIQWQWLVITTISIGALLVSGRRKMVYMIPFFIITFAAIIIYSRIQKGGAKSLISLIAPIALVIIAANWVGAESEFIRYYTDDPENITTQAQTHIIDSVLSTFQQSGFFGHGFGFATPGAQNLPFPRPRIWQESGPSRFAAELGVPGLVAIVLLVGQLLVSGLKSARTEVRQNNEFSLYSIGMLAFVITNFASLAISGQILADPFISSFLGISIGMQLSFSRLATKPRLLIGPDRQLYLLRPAGHS